MTAPMRLWPLALSLVAAASCDSGAKLAASKFSGPSAVAAFHGYSPKHPGESAPRSYVAVANLLRDELTVLDPLDDEPVLSSTLAFPLSIPTHPRPARLASARLEDGAAPQGPDLLVVASQSPPSVQLVTTWTEELRAVDLPAADDLATAFPGAALLSLAAVTRPGGGAWVFAGLTGGNLAVLEFERDPASTLPVARRPVVRTSLALQRQDLVTGAGRFDPLDLAAAPDGSRLFVATTDPLQTAGGATVYGVGQLTTGGTAGAVWPAVGLDARAPTRLLTAGVLASRSLASSLVFEAPSLQVFAVLDEQGCGPSQAIGCGVVTILPDTGIAPDPAGELPYRAPIAPGSNPVAIGLVMPRQGGDSGTPVGVSAPVSLDLLALPPSSATGSPVRLWQTALLVVGLADGALAAIDPGRWSQVNALQRRDADRRLLVNGSFNGVADENTPHLGLWTTLDPAAGGEVVITTADMAKYIQSTAGYTPDQVFTIAWQGMLPFLAGRTGILQWSGGQPVIAIQTGQIVGLHVDDPSLGVQVGDLVQVVPSGATCTVTSNVESGFGATVTAILPASAQFPGGALALSHAGAGPGAAGDTACQTGADLVSAASPGPVAGSMTVRAQGLVLSGNSLGYLGRPVKDQVFELRWRDEAGLTGEALAINRKLRRLHYPPDGPCGASIPGTETATAAALTFECDPSVPADPLTPGPALRFRLGVEGQAATPGAGASLRLTASSGMTGIYYRSPVTRGIPTGITWVDASLLDPPASSARVSTFFASLVADEVIAVEPNTGDIISVR